MIYKLYRETSAVKSDRGTELFEEFNTIAQNNDVKVVGIWENKQNPKETYTITGYQDENHYEKFVTQIKNHSRYQEMTKELDQGRESIDIIDLNDLGGSVKK